MSGSAPTPRRRSTCISGSLPGSALPVAVVISALAGAFIGFLAFRFRIAGVYFAILTIAFAEFARIGFDHFSWVGGSAGFFLPVANYAANDLWNLRGRPVMFYYVMLALTLAALVLCHLLLKSRIGYFWQAIREDEEAARALGIDTFRYKMIAVVLSAGMTSIAGVFFAFYYNNLFPEQVFHISRSIELILAPIIGGIGTLFGPIIGAFLLTGLAEAIFELMNALGWTCRAPSRCSTASASSSSCCAAGGRVAAAAPQARPRRDERQAGGVTWRCSRSPAYRRIFPACARCRR